VKENTLTVKQENFCQKYVEIGNASAAYRYAYDCKKMKPETINTKAFELIRNGKIADRLKELHGIHLKRHEVTVDRIVSELEKLAFLDVRKLFNDDGTLKPLSELDNHTAAAIISIEVEELYDEEDKKKVRIGRTKKVKIADKKASLDSLARVFGAFNDKTHVVEETYEGMVERLAREQSGVQ
jgi:phage terminase small subunit